MIRLTVKQGSIVQTLSVDSDKVFIGRLDSNSVRLEDETVSRKHCMIRQAEGGHLEVLDLNSRHGTRKNGESVDRARISVGDEIGVGDVRIYVESGDGAPVAAASHPGGKAAVALKAGSPARESKVLISEGHRTTFSETLYRQARRTPWWAASLCLHTVLVYLLFAVPFQPTVEETPFGAIDGRIGEDYGSDMEEMAAAPEHLLEAVEEEDLMSFPELDDIPPSPAVVPEDLEDSDRDLIPEIGPSMDAFAARLSPPGNSSDIEIPDGDFGQDAAVQANERANELLKRALNARGSKSLGLLRKLTAHEILVVQGHYDKVETVLDLLNLKYQSTDVRRLEGQDLGGRKAVFINCSNQVPGDRAIRRVRDFVKRGGYLISSDWGIENVVKRAFPGFIEPVMRRNRNVITPNEVITIRIAKGREKHFLLAGTSLERADAKWWLEESSYPFKVLKEGTVEVLIESDDLQREYGTRAVAVTFRYGEGRVLHMLGHFFQKEGNLKGAFSAQRLVANFLIASIRGR